MQSLFFSTIACLRWLLDGTVKIGALQRERLSVTGDVLVCSDVQPPDSAAVLGDSVGLGSDSSTNPDGGLHKNPSTHG